MTGGTEGGLTEETQQEDRKPPGPRQDGAETAAACHTRGKLLSAVLHGERKHMRNDGRHPCIG